MAKIGLIFGGIALLIVVLLAVSTVFAGEIVTPTKEVLSKASESPFLSTSTSDYPTLRIKNSQNDEDLADYKVVQSGCGFTTCRTQFKVILYKTGKLFDQNMSYYDLIYNKSIPMNTTMWLRVADKNYTITLDDYDTICAKQPQVNGSMMDVCTSTFVGTHEETRGQAAWEVYDYTALPPGNYEIEIRGTIKNGEKIDVIPYAQTLKLDEFAVWTSGLNDGLMAYYTMNETSGKLSRDTVSGIHNITTAADIVPTASGKIDYARTWASATEAGTVQASTTNLQGNTMAYAFWAYVPAPAWGTGYGAYFGQNGATWMLAWHNAGGLGAGKMDWYVAPTHYIGTTAPPTGEWFFVVLNRNSATNATVYINGAFDKSWTTGSVATGNQLYIGRNDQFLGLRGNLDEFGIWNRVLTTDEIAILYNEGSGLSHDPNPASADSCTAPVAGTNWAVTWSDNCTITENTNIAPGNITITGAGRFTVLANLTTHNVYKIATGAANWSITPTGRMIKI